MVVVIKRNLKQYVEKIRGGKESVYFDLITKTIQASHYCEFLHLNLNAWLSNYYKVSKNALNWISINIIKYLIY